MDDYRSRQSNLHQKRRRFKKLRKIREEQEKLVLFKSISNTFRNAFELTMLFVAITVAGIVVEQFKGPSRAGFIVYFLFTMTIVFISYFIYFGVKELYKNGFLG